jgi:superfamily II DNA/RNA helicase
VTNAFIFCNRKRDIATLKQSLERHGMDVECLHGDMSQSARNAALKRFKDNEVKLLVASDVAARGIDIAGLSHVFNFDIPHNPEDYVHRIGRTGRAGMSGRAFSLIANDDDQGYLAAIEKLIGKSILTLDGSNTANGDSTKTSPAKSSSKSAKSTKSTTSNDEKTDITADDNAPTNDNKTSSRKAKGQRHHNRNVEGERDQPPDCSGNSFRDTEHTPAFLLKHPA